MGSKDIGGSLPPGIVGPLRGYIEIGLQQLNWFTSKPIHTAVVRLNWKHVTGKITNVYQRSNCQELSFNRRRVKYVIRCLADQFENYLTSLDVLTVKLLTNKSGILLGRGKLHNSISVLTSVDIVRKSLDVLNDTGEKIAQLILEFKMEMLEHSLDLSKIPKRIKKTKVKLVPLNIRRSPDVKVEYSGEELSIAKSDSNDLMQVLQGKVLQLKSALSNLIEENVPDQFPLLKENPKDDINECVNVLSTALENSSVRKFHAANVEQEIVNFLLENNLNEDERKILSTLSEDYSSNEDDDFDYLSDSGDNTVNIQETLDQLLFSSETIMTETKLQTIQTQNENSRFKKKFDINKCKMQNVKTASHSKTKSTSKIVNRCNNSVNIRLKDKNARPPSSDVKRNNVKPILLHCMLCIPCGCNFQLSSPRNLYLVCRTFSNIDHCYSDVCWNVINPKFDFKQVIPVLMTDELLSRLQNNFMVVEVWQKTKTQSVDELIGICKLPVNTIYMSFKDEELKQRLIKLKKPVVAVDGLLPVVNFTTITKLGDLEVFLSFGTPEQMNQSMPRAVDRSRNELKTLRPISAGSSIIMHKFTFSSVGLKLQNPPGSIIWGESDCYVEYVFPKQKTHLKNDELCLCYHKLKPLLCEPEIYFDDEITHEFYLPTKSTIRNILSKVYSGTGMSIFVYCRYYYPQEHDALVAKTFLSMQQLMSVFSVKIKAFKLILFSGEKTADKFEQNKRGAIVGEIKFTVRYEQSNLKWTEVPSILYNRTFNQEASKPAVEKAHSTSSKEVDNKSISVILKHLNVEDLEYLRIMIDKRLNSQEQTSIKMDDTKNVMPVPVQSAFLTNYEDTNENVTKSQPDVLTQATCVSKVKKKSRIAAAIFK
ncbi:C2 domain-containing protein 3 [Chamberlinius hualienensis]